MKKIICALLAVMMLSGCSGVSQADYDAVVKERDALKAQIEQQDLLSNESQTNISEEEEKQNAKQEAKSQVLYEKDGIKITFTGLGESYMGPDVNVTIENSTDFGITVQARNVSINGVMTKPTFSCEVMPGKKAKDGISFFADDIDGGKIENIELSFTFFKTETFETFADSDIVSIKI